MKNAMKGAILSGLVFPGLGQIVLKRKQRGLVIVAIVLVCLAIFVKKIMGVAMAIVEETQSQGGVVDLTSISNSATQLTTGSTELTLNLLLILVLACWIGSIIDAYRIGIQLDNADVR